VPDRAEFAHSLDGELCGPDGFEPSEDLVDELILHQVPVLPGAGRRFFQELPEHVRLRLLETIPAPGVTHLHYAVVR
jgi:hypothetical protein